MNRYISEFIGTFALVFCGTGAIVINNITGGVVGHLGIAVTFGLIVMAMIYAFGEISGAHLNPAVSIGFWMSGRFERKALAPYIIAQCLGAIAASSLLLFLFPNNAGLGGTEPSGSVMQSFVMEVILTFFLMLVIIMVSTGSKETGTVAGLVIGATVLLEALFAGPISGASMNPARSLGPALLSGQFQHLWIYFLAPAAGSVLAIGAFKLTRN